MSRYRAVIVVLAADGAYAPAVRAIRETWGGCVPDDMLLLYNHARSVPDAGDAWLEGDCLFSNGDDLFENISLKSARALDYVSRTFSFDYYVRCCCGSYMHLDRLREHLANMPRRMFYSGLVGRAPWALGRGLFCSGSCYILSEDAAARVASDIQHWDTELIDDVALGRLARRKGIRIHDSSRRYDLPSSDDPEAQIARAASEDATFECHYHYHFRNQPGYLYGLHRHFMKTQRNATFVTNKRQEGGWPVPADILLPSPAAPSEVPAFSSRAGEENMARMVKKSGRQLARTVIRGLRGLLGSGT